MSNRCWKLCIVLMIFVAFGLVFASCGGDEETETTTATSAQVTTTAPAATTTTAPAATTTASSEATETTLGGKDKILIGAARPLDGPLNFFETNAFGPCYKMWVDEVNAEGGIYVAEYGKKLPVEMLVYNDQSDMDMSMQLLEKLIVEDKVDFVFAPASTAFIFAAAKVANDHGYLMISAEGGATSIRELLPELPMFFGLMTFSDWYQLPVLGEIYKEVGVKTVGIIALDDLHGIEYQEVMRAEMAKIGVEIVYDVTIPMGTADFSSVLRQAQEANPDCLCVFAYPDQNFPMTAQMMQLGYNPNMLVMGPGTTYAAFPYAMGGEGGPESGYKVVDGVCGYGAWSLKTPEFAAKAEQMLARPDMDPSKMNFWGYALFWGGLDFFKQAIEKAGTLDNAKVAEVMKTEHFQTILGDTWWDNQLLAVECQPGQIGQWQNGFIEVIDPGDKRTAPPVYPKPPWPTN